LVPAKEYFKDHPKYFALSREGRTARQLCTTHPETIRIATETARRWAKEGLGKSGKPDEIIIAMNDGAGWCECESCRVIVAEDGSPFISASDYDNDRDMVLSEEVQYGTFSYSAPVIKFVNQIADELREDYPEVKFRTLAYQRTQIPPTSVRPSSNVVVTYCPISASMTRPFYESGHWRHNDLVAERTVEWARVSPSLYMWLYPYTGTWRPMPNHHTLQPNIRWMAELGVKGMFAEVGYYRGGNIYMPQLRAYLIAQLFWDPNTDLEQETRRYLSFAFGDGADDINTYLQLMREQLVRGDFKLLHGTRLGPSYYARELLYRLNLHFDKAEEAVADDPEVLARVRNARTGLRYVTLRHWDTLHSPRSADEKRDLERRYAQELQLLTEHLDHESYERGLKHPRTSKKIKWLLGTLEDHDDPIDNVP
jgi:hypothetical protein